jgi:hypothetical protein
VIAGRGESSNPEPFPHAFIRKIPQEDLMATTKKMEIVGTAYQDAKKAAKKYSHSSRPVLFVGDTGCGKELFASLYMAENKRSGLKQTVNCAAFTESLLESEIFGHKKEAFTGATQDRRGILRTCEKGILFFDEIGSASPQFQAKVLRVVEGHGFRPVGADKEEPIDCLIIAATNDLSNIRPDLIHRFHIFHIPPLQKYDIPVLAKHFLGRPLKKVIIDELMAREYPGNVRQLKQQCEKLSIEKGETIFGKRDVKYFDGEFDYGRFVREMTAWNEYIVPILKKHQIDERYRYFPYSENKKVSALHLIFGNENNFGLFDLSVFLKKNLDKENDISFEFQTKQNIVQRDGTVKTVQSAIPERMIDLSAVKILPEFRRALRRCLENGYLPFLLEQLRQSTEPVKHTLFDLTYEEAMAHFIKDYYAYNSRRYDDLSQFKKATGHTKRYLRQKIERLKPS